MSFSKFYAAKVQLIFEICNKMTLFFKKKFRFEKNARVEAPEPLAGF
jgi:hypothetical protein